MDYIPLAECEERVIYKLHSRNLEAGVFDGKEGFIGVREKFWSLFLDTEYHGDTGPPHGTAWPLERIGEVPEGIPLRAWLPELKIENANLFALLRQYVSGLGPRLMNLEQWEEYFDRLDGPEGCDFQGEGKDMTWDCKGGMDKTFSEKILADMLGEHSMKAEGVLSYVEGLGGHCDCEVLFNAAARIREEFEE